MSQQNVYDKKYQQQNAPSWTFILKLSRLSTGLVINTSHERLDNPWRCANSVYVRRKL